MILVSKSMILRVVRINLERKEEKNEQKEGKSKFYATRIDYISIDTSGITDQPVLRTVLWSWDK